MFTNNINTPEPGTFPTTPVYPNGIAENIFQYASEGIFKQNQLIVNINVRAGAKLTLFGYYTLNYANSEYRLGATLFRSKSNLEAISALTTRPQITGVHRLMCATEYSWAERSACRMVFG